MNGDMREFYRNSQYMFFLQNLFRGLARVRFEGSRINPFLESKNMDILKSNYYLVKREMDFFAGHHCQWFWLLPKHQYGYTVSFCAEINTHFPLNLVWKNDKGEEVEHARFHSINFNPKFTVEEVSSKSDLQYEKYFSFFKSK